MARRKNALLKAEIDLAQEQLKQINILYPASAIVLWRDYGWRKVRILRRFATSQEVWHECADYGIEKSILEMMEEETGIEMSLSGFDKSFHELAYFSKDAYDGKLLDFMQTVYMRQQQKKWLAPSILSAICISLHRDDKWGGRQDRKIHICS